MTIGVQRDIPLEDAMDLAEMAVMLGRVVPASKWVEEMRLAAEADSMRQFGY